MSTFSMLKMAHFLEETQRFDWVVIAFGSRDPFDFE